MAWRCEAGEWDRMRVEWEVGPCSLRPVGQGEESDVILSIVEGKESIKQ